MQQHEVTALFDQQAANYDSQWQNMAPISQALYFMMSPLFCKLPSNAHILCVGAGTGNEILHLAQAFPAFRFTAVEPSTEMIKVCKHNLTQAGVAHRCQFHNGYVDSLKNLMPFDAATAVLVSQFIIEEPKRVAFFADIHKRLKPGGLLVSADLSANQSGETYPEQLSHWLSVMSSAAVSPEQIERVKLAYENDVALRETHVIENIITESGFTGVYPFYQAGLIKAFTGVKA